MNTTPLAYESVWPALAQARSRAWLLALGGCLVGVLLWLHARYALIWVVGESMRPTIPSSSLVLMNKLAYRDAAPRYDDLVVARCQNELIAKRIVGLPGQTVGVKMGVLYVNGTPIVERHRIEPGSLTIEAGTLFTDRYALLGDNRDLSSATAVHAVVPRDHIVGKVVAQLPRLPFKGTGD